MTTRPGDNFFVVGLPRSRTAWLANFLTDDRQFCFHECADGCYTPAEYKKKLGSNGDSGTSLMMLDMAELFPDAPLVIIERDPKHMIAFVRELFGACDVPTVLKMHARLNAMKGMRVNYADINDRLEEIWQYLRGDKFDARRAAMLRTMDVQVIDPLDFDFKASRSLMGVA